jgi:hypothetical protein
MPAPAGPVLDVAGYACRGPQPGVERGDDQGAEQAADLGGGQRDGPPWRAGCQGSAGGGGAAAAAQAVRNARASMTSVTCRCQPVQVRTWYAAIKDAGYLHIPEGRRDHATPPKPSTSTASIKTETHIQGTRRSSGLRQGHQVTLSYQAHSFMGRDR